MTDPHSVVTRHLDWEGFFNARDLGGLRARNGLTTRWGAVVRSEAPDRLTPAGWAALRDHGIRTIIDLRNPDECHAGIRHYPNEITRIHVPLDDVGDTDLWRYISDSELDGTPLYFLPFMQRKPERCAAAIAAVANAEPGGVLIHCAAGRDRTGLVTLMLLAIAGVRADDIATDYELSAERLPAAFAALGVPDDGPIIREILARKNITVRQAVHTILEAIEVDSHLLTAGLSKQELATVRARLLAAE
jgi:protein-tyrosine phosphatase